jgi:Spy/CpxP family protein refolding chaperone
MKLATLAATVLLSAGMAAGQQMKTPGPGGPPPGEGQGQPRMRAPMADREQAEMKMRRGGPFPGGGKWWKNSEVVQKIGISDSQVQEMEKIFQDYRMKLIDQRAALQKEELALEPLIESDQPDEVKVGAQIDRVANARAALEKANAMMFLAIRKTMTIDQWKKLQQLTPPPPPPPGLAPPAPGAPEPPGMKRRMPGGGELD